VQQSTPEVGEACAHLHGGALAPCAAAEEMGDDGAEQHHGRHAPRQQRTAVQQCVDDEVRAGAHRRTVALVRGAECKAR
jgi:hypothetical protein